MRCPRRLHPNTPLLRPALYGCTKYLTELILAENAALFGVLNVRLPGIVAPGYLTPWIGQIVSKAMEGASATAKAFQPLAPQHIMLSVGITAGMSVLGQLASTGHVDLKSAMGFLGAVRPYGAAASARTLFGVAPAVAQRPAIAGRTFNM